jgi:hypothetical protein
MTGPSVVVTRGRKYHLDRECPRMVSAEHLRDCQGGPGPGRDSFTTGSSRTTDPAPDRAAARGKLPCLYCVPAAFRIFPPLHGQTFGHEPVTGLSLFGLAERICQRCTEPGVWYARGADELTPGGILWPCTSAIVLGLVERPREQEASRG